MEALIKNPHMIVDADVLLYRCGFAAEKAHYLIENYSVLEGDEKYVHAASSKEAQGALEDMPGVIWTRREVQPVENALNNLKTTIRALVEKYNPCTASFFLTGKGNFRETVAVAAEYKGNRDPAQRPKHYRALKDYLVANGAMIVNGYEADDAVASEAYLYKDTSKYVVVSNDKDLDQIPGWHYDWTQHKEWYVEPEDAMKVFYIQLLCGDRVDNIPGIMSEKKATEMISGTLSPKQAASACLVAYKEKYGTWDYMQKMGEIAQLVWIKRSLNAGQDGFVPPIVEHLKEANI